MKRLYRWFLIFVTLFLLSNLSGCMDVTPQFVQVTEDVSIFENKFYYGQLTSEAEQYAYREIYTGIMEQQEEIYIHEIDADRANNILHHIIYDFPLVFWTDGRATSTTIEETLFSDGFTVVEVDYLYTLDERKQKEAEIKSAAESILNTVPAEYGEYDKIKYIYEYLVNQIDYVEDAPDNQNIYSALVGNRTVCAGYAKATQYLLNELGIYCTFVTGTATNEEGTQPHGWNIVRCNDKYYYVDTTWADPYFMEGQVETDEVSYDYLCCSEAVLEKTHVLDEGYELPACTSDDLDYYRLNNLFYERADKWTLLNAMKASIRAKAENTTFKFASTETYEQAKQMLLDELLNSAAEYLCERYGLQEVEYFYQDYTTTNRFVVYWQYK